MAPPQMELLLNSVNEISPPNFGSPSAPTTPRSPSLAADQPVAFVLPNNLSMNGTLGFMFPSARDLFALIVGK